VYQRIAEKDSRVEIRHIDVSSGNDKQVQAGFIERVDKIKSKNTPTVFVRANNCLRKIKATKINSSFGDEFWAELSKLTSVKLIWSIKDLADALKHGNQKIDDVTIVYCHSKEQDPADVELALKFLRHESSNQVLEVRADSDLANELRMTEGKFYTYYKPS